MFVIHYVTCRNAVRVPLLGHDPPNRLHLLVLKDDALRCHRFYKWIL